MKERVADLEKAKPVVALKRMKPSKTFVNVTPTAAEKKVNEWVKQQMHQYATMRREARRSIEQSLFRTAWRAFHKGQL
jgi:hypothetical protein